MVLRKGDYKITIPWYEAHKLESKFMIQNQDANGDANSVELLELCVRSLSLDFAAYMHIHISTLLTVYKLHIRLTFETNISLFCPHEKKDVLAIERVQ